MTLEDVFVEIGHREGYQVVEVRTVPDDMSMGMRIRWRRSEDYALVSVPEFVAEIPDTHIMELAEQVFAKMRGEDRKLSAELLRVLGEHRYAGRTAHMTEGKGKDDTAPESPSTATTDAPVRVCTLERWL